ncbi:MAG TPA: D-2-hydroxyacid dehydrogenase [Gammaproteobacteria bacterium]|nr:D-2-hydroxyacid dehydrogenase [Gammaproteobacteria bacterium]
MATVDQGDLDLSPLHEAVDGFESWPVTPPDDVITRIRDAEVVIVNKTRLDAAVFQAAQPGLVCLAATGTDNVDLGVARELGIGVANIRDYCTDSVAQHVFALILALTVRLVDYRGSVRAGAWTQSETFAVLDFPVRELAGKTLAIVGYGTLGHAVAERAQAFGMRVIVAERKGQTPRAGRVPFEQALAEADVLSLHAPLTPDTRALIDADALGLMKPDALLINTARGGLVDETALAGALARHEIGGAGLDVLGSEPPPADNPLLDPMLDNCLVTPHIAWAAREARQRAITKIAENITAWRASERRNRVD